MRAALLVGIPENAERILHYALTEMVNNAVDHSGSERVVVEAFGSGPRAGFEVSDEGVGIFDHVRERLGLADRMAALQEISKGKVTTDPDHHTGEGIFFVSKIADFFEIDSGGLSWKVDGERGDMAVGSAPSRRGTRVRFEVAKDKSRRLADLFAEYAKDYEFTKTRVVVKLFAIGVRFVSRSEAKRLLHGLERFREVVLDFAGVTEIGQGFADEVFRVWARGHPEVRLDPVAMMPEVRFMVERAGGLKPGGEAGRS
ncbi:MAG: DUF4325 domain-containing protein [Planctomycetes bacterium]|nr:DUF4325 domain-containing protein [Planctomycetota bacterium]